MLNGHTESPVFAPPGGTAESELWPVREDVWATVAESFAAAEYTGQESFEDMPTGHSAPEYGAFEESGTSDPREYAGESGLEYAGESSTEYGAQEESALEQVGLEDASWESIHAAGESAYSSSGEDTSVGRSAIGDEQPAGEQFGYEESGYEQTGYEDAPYEDALESGALAQAGEQQALESSFEMPMETAFESPYESPHESPFESPFEWSAEYPVAENLTETSVANPEMSQWSGEVVAEDWAAGSESSGPTYTSSESAEDQQEQSAPLAPAGERVVTALPMLRTHRGTRPDLVVRWTAMRRSTTSVDVVVHLHGYSSSGPRMKIQDKAALSGVDFRSPGAAGSIRPLLGLIPRGNYFGGQSGAGYNFPALVRPGAIAELVAGGLELLRTQTGVTARIGRLILTGHSGGGAPVNAILAHTDADEVHIFDGSYGDMSNVVAWARRRIARGTTDSALRVLFRPNSGTAKHALAIAAAICPAITASADAASLHRRFRVEATTVEHNLIPRTFGGRLLANPAGDLPGAVRRGCAHGGQAPSGTPTTPPAVPQRPGPEGGARSPVTRTPDRMAGVVKVTPYSKDGTRALPGAVALAAQWRRLTGRTAGTFNPRNTAFGTRSLHSEGRAVDCHGRVSVPAEAAQAESYIRWLMANAVELQVSTIIWNRRIWSWPRRAQGWRSYMTRPNHNPHTDHFHVDLSWEGAQHPSPLFAGGVAAPAGVGAPGPASASPPGHRLPPDPAPPTQQPPPGGSKRSPADFVRSFGPYAKASEARTGVPGLVTLAQAAVESGWGARAAGNNFFGIKARAADAPGTRQLWRTREVLARPDVRSFPEVISVSRRADGRYDYVVRDWFRVFPSPELAFVGHGEFLRRNKRYAAAFTFQTDPYRFAAEVARAGYATDPSYTKVVHSVMRLLERSGWR